MNLIIMNSPKNNGFYTIRKISCLALGWLFFWSVAAQESEYGFIANVTLRKTFNPWVELMMQQNVWWKNSTNGYERYMPVLGFDFTLIKSRLKLNAHYYYLNQRDTKGKTYNRHRYHLGLTGYQNIGPVSAALFSRLESTYTIGSKDNPLDKWRNRFQFTYNIPDSRWKPYLWIDFFNFLNKKGAHCMELDQIWYFTGVEYKINAHNAIDLRYRFHHVISSNPHTLTSLFCIYYKIKL